MYRIAVYRVITSLFVGLIFAFLCSISAYGFSFFDQYEEIEAVNGELKIPVRDIDDGNAYYFSHKIDGNDVKFFIVKSLDGVIRAAFDACDVCYPAQKGYTQDGDFMICNNCGRRFHSTRINVEKGGCNPAPLAREIVGKQLVIKVSDLTLGSKYFGSQP